MIWTVNDSGNPPVVYGIGADGGTRVRLRVTGVPNVDWEAVAAWRDATGRALVAVGDIGDNGAVRDGIEVDVFAEPAQLPASPGADDADGVPEREVRPLRRIRLRYPDQAKDAESLLVDPRSQRMYVVAKGLLRARVYLVPQSAWPGGASEPVTLEFIGGLGLPLATDAAMLPTGHVVLRSYSTAMLVGAVAHRAAPARPARGGRAAAPGAGGGTGCHRDGPLPVQRRPGLADPPVAHAGLVHGGDQRRRRRRGRHRFTSGFAVGPGSASGGTSGPVGAGAGAPGRRGR